MDVNYEANNFMSNDSFDTEYYESSTAEYFDDNSSEPEPVTESFNETDYQFPSEFDRNVYALIFIIGFVGNCMVILVVITWPQMRTVTNLFIMNLAVADLLVIIFCVPAELLFNIFWPWILGSVMCKIVQFMELVSVCASAYSLAAISLDRCKAIYRPQAPPKGLSKRQAFFTVCLIWIFSLTLITPYIVIFEERISGDIASHYCRQLWGSNQEVHVVVLGVLFLYGLPLVLIVISNIIIWWNVSKRKTPVECAPSSRIGRMHRETRQNVGKMLGIVTLAFLLSWLLLHFYVTKFHVIGYKSTWEFYIFEPVAVLFGFSNSSINPVLYAFLSKKFRDAFKSLLPNWLPCVHRTENKCVSGATTTSSITSVTK